MKIFETPDCSEGYGFVYERGHSLSYRYPLQEARKLSQHINNPDKKVCLNDRIKIDVYNGDLSSKRWERTDWLIIQALTEIKDMTIHAYNELKWSKRLMQMTLALLVPTTTFFTINHLAESFATLDPLIKLGGIALLGGITLLATHPITESWRCSLAAREMEITKLSKDDILKNWSDLAN